jgi:V8-like Glu-specific endopeptidase
MRRTRLRILFIVWIVLSGFYSSFCRATIFDADDREYVSTAPGSPFSAVGLVTRGLIVEHFATGTLVDECDVLTSQHIFGSQDSPVGKRANFTGAVGTTFQVSSGGTVIAFGGLERYRGASQQYQARAHDWLLLRLDQCLGATLGFAELRNWPAGSDGLSHVQSAGYPVGRHRRSGLTLDPSCEVRGTYEQVWLNDCATSPGNSGGPVFRLDRSSQKPRLEVYAIQSAGFYERKAIPFRKGIENQATPVSAILPHIEAYLSGFSKTGRTNSAR